MNGHAAVLVIGYGGDDLNNYPPLSYWALPEKLKADYHIYVGGMFLQTLDQSFDDPEHPEDPLWALRPFNAVILCGLPEYNPDAIDTDERRINQNGIENLVGNLSRYVNEGGGLYIYGHSYVAAGSQKSNEALNRFTQTFGAALVFEELRDPPKEAIQSGGMRIPYALADSIRDHPATADVENFWYPVGMRESGYGPWTVPLELDTTWTPLIRTSDAATPRPAAIYAFKTIDKGRVILNGSESTISFFNYDYSPYANGQWGTIGADGKWGSIGMENGLTIQKEDGQSEHIGSDGLKLLGASLKWLVEPSMNDQQFGGFVPPPPPGPPTAPPVSLWNKPGFQGEGIPDPTPDSKYLKGVIGAVPALVGGHYSDSVHAFILAAQEQHLDFLVLAADFEVMENLGEVTGANLWEEFQRACAENGELLNVSAIPALLTRDAVGNRFITTKTPPWPQPAWLSTPLNQVVPSRKNRIRDHLAFWFASSQAFRAPYDMSHGHYPSWLYSGYSAFPVRTYQNNTLVEDQFIEFLQNEEQGDLSLIFVMTLLHDPALLKEVPEYTYIRRDHMNCFTEKHYSGGAMSFVSNGPLIEYFATGGPATANRQTFGKLYHPGSERWRLFLRVRPMSSADSGNLKHVILRDRQRVIRRFAAQGGVEDFIVDLLHDSRHVLTFEVEDSLGRKAITGSIANKDKLMAHALNDDRCEGGGSLETFDAEPGLLRGVFASNSLGKAGRLSFYPPVSDKDKELPGVDGSAGLVEFGHQVSFTAIRGDAREGGNPVHQTRRVYESADAFIFDTPILKRTTHPDPYGTLPYVPLSEPKIQARLTRHFFYRRPSLPSAVLADLSLTFPNPGFPVPSNPGWQNFTQLYTDAGTMHGVSFQTILVMKNNIVERFVFKPEGEVVERTLGPGDFVLFPEAGEGFFVLAGTLWVMVIGTLGVVDGKPDRILQLYTGKSDANTDPVRVLALRTVVGDMSEDAVRDDWIKFRDDYGLTGKPPGYDIAVTQGKILSTNYLLHARAENFGVNMRISSHNLPMRIPMRIDGLNPNWTAGKVNLDKKEWFPLAVANKKAFTTLTQNVESHFYIGNLVTARIIGNPPIVNPQVFLTLLPHNSSDNKTVLDIHNPTHQQLDVEVTVPISTFLAKQTQDDRPIRVRVDKGSTERIELDR